jgi:thiol-disulfide isomerase/thioredoxin
LQFEHFSKNQIIFSNKIQAWSYLEKIYSGESGINNTKLLKAIQNEEVRLVKEEHQRIESFKKDTSLAWYIETRLILDSVANNSEIPSQSKIFYWIKAFQRMSLSNQLVWQSGLLKDILDSQFWLIENSGLPLEICINEMNISIDSLFTEFNQNNEQFNQVIHYVFQNLERRSLYQSSEYLALKALNHSGCAINPELAKQFESYRAMRIGNRVPDISFPKENFTKPDANPKSLSDFKSEYVLVVFGASWCEKCIEEIPQIARYYNKWKSKGLDVLYISLDESEKENKSFSIEFPFSSYCDYLKWESPLAKTFYVFGTPSMFILDANQTIQLKPFSIQQIDSWVDYYLR